MRDRLSALVAALSKRRRKDEGLGLAEEKPQADEEAHLDDIIATFSAQLRRLWHPGYFERGGNTKTHGLVRAEFTVRDDLPLPMRHGIFAEPRTYRAWVRYSGPGPYVTTAIADVGFISRCINLLMVPVPKLLDDEQLHQDRSEVSHQPHSTPHT